MEKEEYRLEKATRQHMDLLYHWVNEEECRKNSFTTAVVLYEEHKKWFEEKLSSENCSIFILYVHNMPVGQIRIEKEAGCGYIGYSVSKEYRNKGYGTILLQLAEEEAKKKEDITCLIGKVKYENITSANRFRKLGYSEEKEPFCLTFKKSIKPN